MIGVRRMQQNAIRASTSALFRQLAVAMRKVWTERDLADGGCVPAKRMPVFVPSPHPRG